MTKFVSDHAHPAAQMGANSFSFENIKLLLSKPDCHGIISVVSTLERKYSSVPPEINNHFQKRGKKR
jgi:hypothetical protein